VTEISQKFDEGRSLKLLGNCVIVVKIGNLLNDYFQKQFT